MITYFIIFFSCGSIANPCKVRLQDLPKMSAAQQVMYGVGNTISIGTNNTHRLTFGGVSGKTLKTAIEDSIRIGANSIGGEAKPK